MGWFFYFLILQREEIVEIKTLKPMERSHTFITQSFHNPSQLISVQKKWNYILCLTYLEDNQDDLSEDNQDDHITDAE